MSDPRKVFSAPDLAPAALFTKRDEDSQEAHPLLQDPSGALHISSGFKIPTFDYIEFVPASNPTTIIFQKGGVTVGTLAIVYSGTDIQSITRTA